MNHSLSARQAIAPRARAALLAPLLAALISLVTMLVAPPSQAQAYQTQAKCGNWLRQYHTNGWDVFSGHKLNVSLGICHNGTHVLWGKNPQITLPTRNVLTGALEDVEVISGPTISKKTTYIGGISKVTWRFSIKQKVSMTPMSQTFDFTVEIFPMGSRICFAGGKCDSTKRW